MSKSPFEQAGGKRLERPGMFADVKQHDNPPDLLDSYFLFKRWWAGKL